MRLKSDESSKKSSKDCKKFRDIHENANYALSTNIKRILYHSPHVIIDSVDSVFLMLSLTQSIMEIQTATP